MPKGAATEEVTEGLVDCLVLADMISFLDSRAYGVETGTNTKWRRRWINR
jgi:hypothetical protein